MQDRLTKATTVRSALDVATTEPLIVSETASIPETASAWATHPEIRVICVVNSQGRLSGIIRVGLICNALFLRVAPEEFLPDILKPERIVELGRLSHAQRAVDLMEEAKVVLADDSIFAAFRQMHTGDLEGLPVVNSDGKPVAYLDRIHLVVVWLRTHP